MEPAVATVVPTSRNGKTAATFKTAAPQTAAVAFAAPANAEVTSTAAAPPLSGLLSAIGTIVFNLYGFATRLVGGPPILPPNSTVTVRSSTLRIDCADGYEVPADWYIPAGAEENPPQRLIYLQHGFLAGGPWYSYTAATLAEQTNSIVVAPSITSNFLSCDACWLGAPPMQEAVANLFEDDNTALADSALAAGYTGPIPDRVVLVGHSLGGGLVAGTAGDMVDNGTVDRLAGVVMLDGVGLDGSMATSLEKVPDEIPIYQLAAPEYFWNQFGVGSHALLEARPDQFVGVTLVGGSHVDSMQGGNPLIQFSQELVAGFSMPENVAAAKILMVGWVNDMFAGTHEGRHLRGPQRGDHDRHPCGAGHRGGASQLAHEAVPVESAATARSAGGSILHVRADLRLRFHGRGHLHRVDGCLTPSALCNPRRQAQVAGSRLWSGKPSCQRPRLS